MAGHARGSGLKAAVVGAGAISYQHLAFLGDSDRVDLVGVCDLSPVAGRLAARKFGADSSYTEVGEMLDDTRPDVVHVLTPPGSHPSLVELAIDAGCDVICEKPLAPDSATTNRLLERAAEGGRVLIESQNYRFNDGVLSLLDLIEAEELGPVREVDVRVALPVRSNDRFADEGRPDPIHQMPAGVIHDMLPHMAYLLDSLSGHAQWDEVTALWHNHGGGTLFTVDDLDALLVGHHSDGPVHGRLRFSASTFPDSFSLTVRGGAGQASTDLFHPFVDVRRPRRVGPQLTPIADHLSNGWGLMRAGATNFGQKLLQHSPYHGLTRMLDEIYTALGDGAEPPITARDVRATAELIDRLVACRPGTAPAPASNGIER